MNRPLEEIRDRLAVLDALADPADLIDLTYDLCERVLELEARLSASERASRVAANTAACLANGIIPD